jgi:cell division protein FtsB
MTVPRISWPSISWTGLGLSAAIVYLVAHAVSGEQSVSGTFRLTEQERGLRSELARLEQERASLQVEIEALSEDKLDRDYVEERARVLLGAAYPGEIYVAFPAATPVR